MLTPDKGYPLSPITVAENGSFQNRFSIPSAVLPVVARVQLVDVSIAPVTTIRKLVQRRDQKHQRSSSTSPATTVLRGTIPKASAGAGQAAAPGPGRRLNVAGGSPAAACRGS